MIFARAFGLVVLLAWNIAAAQSPTAKKFDEFGDEELTSTAARLDNFAIALHQEPQMKAFVIAYRSHRDLPGLSSSLAAWLRNYLILNRGFAADRIIAIDGGRARCVTQELWLVQPGAAPAIRDDAYDQTFEPSETARKFFEGSYYAPNFTDEVYSFDISHAFEGFSEALRRDPKANGYLIAYAGYRIQESGDVTETGEWIVRRRKLFIQPVKVARQRLRTYRGILTREYKIPANRIKTVFGGYREWPEMELWIVPRTKRAPIPTPNIFPKGRR